jgi:hypothetical protein
VSDHDNRPARLFSRRNAAKVTLRVAVGSAAALIAAAQKAEAGYGRCSKCNCPAYEGQANTCGNCGHSYASHW